MVGRSLVRHLLESGVHVRALARTPAAGSVVAGLGADPVEGDLLRPDTLAAAFDGCDVVFNVAGVNELCPEDPEWMYRVNVDGARNVLRACARAGVRRLVHTSSAVTVGERRGVLADESTAHRGRYLSAYERSKHHAERVVLGERAPVEVVCVNPSSVQGPGRSEGTGRIVLDVLAGRLPFLIDAPVSMVDIDDCARAHLLTAERGAPGSRYLVSGFTTSVSAAVGMAAEALGRPVRTRIVPVAPVAAGVWVADRVGRLVGWRPPVCPEMIRVAAHGHRYDGSRATRELGLSYTPAAITIERLVGWFRAEGLLT